MTLDGIGIEPFAVLEAASESILVTDADLERPGPIIVYVNPAFERMTGWSAREVIGKSPRILQGASTDLSIFLGMRETLKSGQRWEGQTINYRKNGSQFVMEWSITPLRDKAGQMTHFVAVQRDVTARVEAERRVAQAQQAAREADRKKANLARYFSPAMVETLAQRDHPLGPVRRQAIAVLFVDIVGFVAISESLAPERVVGLLRSFYRRMAKVIFAQRGSIEKFWAMRSWRSSACPIPLDWRRPMRCTPLLTSLTRWSFGMRSGLTLAVVPLMLASAPISALSFSAISGRANP